MAIKSYYYLAKPGIIYGNAIPAIAGFFLASKGDVDFFLLFAMLVGLSGVIGSACVFNNYIDRSIDEKMQRTKQRALVTKKIPVKNAITYAIVLGFIGFSVLLFQTNLLTTLLAFVGFFFYVVMYSIWKRRSSFGTIVGSISGAVPPVVGYCAVTNQFDVGALLLFLLLVFWQMPHFYAIAIFRHDDYAAASIPVLPVKKGMKTTKIHMICYISAFIITSTLFTFFRLTSRFYLFVAIILGLWWLMVGVKGFTTKDTKIWGRNMFKVSLLVLTLLCVILSVDVFLPF